MSQKLRNAGLLAIITGLTVVLVAGNIGSSAATNESTTGGTGGHNVGNDNTVGSSSVGQGHHSSHATNSDKVCGDKLCSEQDDKQG